MPAPAHATTGDPEGANATVQSRAVAAISPHATAQFFLTGGSQVRILPGAMMFVLTAFVYPCVLAVLCVGAGLAVDRCSGGFLPGLLLPAVGAAALIAVSQLATYASPVAPATPYLLAAVAAAGFVLGRNRARMLLRRSRMCRWQLAVPALAYVVGLAPVLFAGRPTFTSYIALSDSAVHMIGADFLIRHGQDYSHLDLRNSYGQFINDYYNTSYPSGADTLFGGSAFLLRLPLIWAFQPFNAFMLATAAGPTWLLLRRMGLDGGWAALAALCTTVSALVYGYELVGSVKEITALPMILTLGVLVVIHARWLPGRPSGGLPFALVAAAGVSALGVGFGAWVLGAAVVLAVIAVDDVLASRQSARRLLLLVGAGALIVLVAALPTWANLSGSLQVAQNIASTTNPGNLRAPLRTEQLFGTWLWASYKLVPTGRALSLTNALIAVAFIAALMGAVNVVRIRAYALAGWLALMLAVWAGLTVYGTTWVDAKVLMLTSPVVVLTAWGGLAAVLRASARVRALAPVAAILALALAGGALASDAMQYHSSNLAPTARYDELASLNARFAGQGPTLFTDYDEYAMYELRDLDVGGPNFIYAPAALPGVAAGHGAAIHLDKAPPAGLRAYPLIVTRRDPTTGRPPAAYSLVWRGTYYEVWRRQAGAPAAIAHVGLSRAMPVECSRVRDLAHLAGFRGAQLLAASPPELVSVSATRARHPVHWTPASVGLVMKGPGRLQAAFAVPHAGAWELWLQGEIMRPLKVSVDGHLLGSVGGQLGGDSLNPDTMAPLGLQLAAGEHRLSITRGPAGLAPGDGGWAFLYRIFLTPAGARSGGTIRTVPPAGWRSLCGHAFDWIEVVRG